IGAGQRCWQGCLHRLRGAHGVIHYRHALCLPDAASARAASLDAGQTRIFLPPFVWITQEELAMSTLDNQAEIVPAKGWRFKCGIGIFILALLLWCLIPIAASLDVPGSRIAALSATVFIANKILLISCIAVMGKEGFQ